MDLTQGINTLVKLRQLTNTAMIALTPIGGNIRYVPIYTQNQDMDSWQIREVEEDIAVQSINEGEIVVSSLDAAKIRVGETFPVNDTNGDFIGGCKVTGVNTETGVITYLRSGAVPFNQDFGDVTSLKLYKDCILRDNVLKPIDTKLMFQIMVKADSDLELNIEILQQGLGI